MSIVKYCQFDLKGPLFLETSQWMCKKDFPDLCDMVDMVTLAVGEHDISIHFLWIPT